MNAKRCPCCRSSVEEVVDTSVNRTAKNVILDRRKDFAQQSTPFRLPFLPFLPECPRNAIVHRPEANFRVNFEGPVLCGGADRVIDSLDLWTNAPGLPTQPSTHFLPVDFGRLSILPSLQRGTARCWEDATSTHGSKQASRRKVARPWSIEQSNRDVNRDRLSVAGPLPNRVSGFDAKIAANFTCIVTKI
ncbi:MAG TPA: hypothetical protein VMQ56_10760 [Terracidiphilus sp.]|nr:hypothetical protein [Terracidiphilus sp.]